MSDFQAPGLARRLAALLYESILLFGVLFTGEMLFVGLVKQSSKELQPLIQFLLVFCLLGIYCTWFWSHGGQTVAMKAWNLRVLNVAGSPLTLTRALMRYFFSWLWFLPAFFCAYLLGGITFGRLSVFLFAGIAAYVLVARLHPRRQFLHDVICGTQLVTQIPTKS